MERARMSDADVVVAATDDDNQNGLIALAARLVYSVVRVVVRVQNPGRVELLESYGITVVSPPELAAQRVVEAISTNDRERAEVD
jgi:trk system potassium uptake protein TrkA